MVTQEKQLQIITRKGYVIIQASSEYTRKWYGLTFTYLPYLLNVCLQGYYWRENPKKYTFWKLKISGVDDYEKE